jgi:hypothetical protein
MCLMLILISDICLQGPTEAIGVANLMQGTLLSGWVADVY